MQRVLVTGGTGFLGQNLVTALRHQGRHVRALVRPHPDHAKQAVIQRLRAIGVEIVVGDLLDSSAVQFATRDVAQVFHLAGHLFVPGVPTQVYERLHIDGTRNLLAACTAAVGLEAIVHVSTTGVLGPTGIRPAFEDAAQHPSNDYERTKAEGERLALSYAEQNGLPVAVARPALVYGPGDLHLLGWFKAILHGYYLVVGKGQNLLHPIFIDDVVQGIMRCAQMPPTARRMYNLVGERPVSIRELATAIADALGTRLPRHHLTAAAAWSVASVLETLPRVSARRLPLTRSRVQFMTESRAYCGDRARTELNFVPRIDLETGLRQTVAWYRAEGLL